MERTTDRMSEEEFKHILVEAIHNELETGKDYIRCCFCNIPRERYPESVLAECCSDGSYGETRRRIIRKLFPGMGELLCDRLWPFLENA